MSEYQLIFIYSFLGNDETQGPIDSIFQSECLIHLHHLGLLAEVIELLLIDV